MSRPTLLHDDDDGHGGHDRGNSHDHDEGTSAAAATVMATAVEINREHALAHTCAATAIQHAIRCGEMLQTKKAELPHGEFMLWVTENCDFQYSTAARYMKAVKQISTPVEISSLSDVFLSGRPALRKNHQDGDGKHHEDHGHWDHENDDANAQTILPYPTWRTGKQKMGEIERAIKILGPILTQQQILGRYQDCHDKVARLQSKLSGAEDDLLDAEARLIRAYRQRVADDAHQSSDITPDGLRQ